MLFFSENAHVFGYNYFICFDGQLLGQVGLFLVIVLPEKQRLSVTLFLFSQKFHFLPQENMLENVMTLPTVGSVPLEG